MGGGGEEGGRVVVLVVRVGGGVWGVWFHWSGVSLGWVVLVLVGGFVVRGGCLVWGGVGLVGCREGLLRKGVVGVFVVWAWGGEWGGLRGGFVLCRCVCLL